MAERNVIQTSFASGELSPNLFAHVDLEQYKSGCATMRNFFVDYRSGASTRAGTEFVIQAFSQNTVRIISFQTSVLVPYVLEFGDGYMRPISMGEPVLETAFNVTAVTLAGTVTLTVPGHNYSVGDWIFVSSLGGTIQLNNRFFVVSNVFGSVITLSDTYGNLVSGVTYSQYTGGGQTNRVYKIVSPYAAADLALLKFVQQGNVMYITHPSYAPRTLTFTAPTNWAFATIAFGTTIGTPTITGVTTSSAGNANYAYEVTAVDTNNQESIPSTPGTVGSAVNIGTTEGTISITWNAVANATSYNVYKAELSVAGAVPSGAGFGYIQTVTGVAAVDSNIVPDFTQTPPVAQNPFANSNNPGVPVFFQQRLYFMGSASFPQTFWGSQPGLYFNFNVSDPTQADDAITGTLVSLQVNYIKAAVPMPGGLIILTAQGAWQLSASGGGLASTAAVTPINAVATPQAYNGVSDVPPIIINQDLLYVQYKNSIVRDLTYNIYANIYTGVDISVFSNHLFFGYQILQWAYAEEPFKVIWCIRNDGVALSLTYLKEQNLQGWARHDTLGLFKSVCTVTEGTLDATYFVVQRKIQGQFWNFIERMANRLTPYGAEDCWAVDCGTQSALLPINTTLNVSASTGTATYTTDVVAFNPANVGWVIRSGGGIGTITAFVSGTEVVAEITQPITQTIPNDPNNTPVPQPGNSWNLSLPATTFYGLDYLNGQLVDILADGNVVTPQVVSNGSITLQKPATKVTVGLSFTPQLQTMPIDIGNDADTIQGKRKKISALTLRLSQTRGLSYGQDFNHLTPIKEFSQSQILGSTIPLVTGDERVIMDPLWSVPGQICIEQDNPLYATVLGVVPEITVGDTKG